MRREKKLVEKDTVKNREKERKEESKRKKMKARVIESGVRSEKNNI